MNDAVTPEPWQALRRHTPARIGLGRAGVSLPTAAHLDFQRAHAEARDAVHRPFNADAVEAGITALGLPTLRLHSAAPDRASYLKRPDLGRRL
ncbi:ethanolamine ammonia-lyase light chain EutC, partial [Rubrivivax gelatinosus]